MMNPELNEKMVPRTSVLVVSLAILAWTSGCGGPDADVPRDDQPLDRRSTSADEDPSVQVQCDPSPEDGVAEGRIDLGERAADGQPITHYRYRLDQPTGTFELAAFADDTEQGSITLEVTGDDGTAMRAEIQGADGTRLLADTRTDVLRSSSKDPYILQETVLRGADASRGVKIRGLSIGSGTDRTPVQAQIVVGEVAEDGRTILEQDRASIAIAFDASGNLQDEDAFQQWLEDQQVDTLLEDFSLVRELLGGFRDAQHGGEALRQLNACLQDVDARLPEGVSRRTQSLGGLGGQLCTGLSEGDEALNKVSTVVNVIAIFAGAAGAVAAAPAAAGVALPLLVGAAGGAVAGFLITEILNNIGPGPFSAIAGRLGCDPYAQTADGLAFEFEAAGDYLWAHNRLDSGFAVQVRQRADLQTACGSRSRVAAVAARVGDHRVAVYADRERPLWIDGQPADTADFFWPLGAHGHVEKPPADADHPVWIIEWTTGERLRIDRPDGRLDLELEVPRERRRGLGGLLGNANGEPADDITLRDGTRLQEPVPWRELYELFAASWRVDTEESLFAAPFDGPGFDGEPHPDRPAALQTLSAAQLATARRACVEESGIADPVLRAHCIDDVGCTGDASFAQTYARWTPPRRELEVLYPDGRTTTELRDQQQQRRSQIGTPPQTHRTARYAACGESSGDPHLVTADGLAFDFQAIGEFVFLESRANDELMIQVRQGSIRANRCPDVTWVTAVAAQIGEHRLGFYADRQERVWLDGEPMDLQEQGGFRMLGAGRSVAQFDDGTVQVQWPDGEALQLRHRGAHWDVSVDLPDTRRGQLHGLMGRFNGTVDDDMVLRDGTQLDKPVQWDELYGRYADSWRIRPDESLFDYAPGEDTSTFTDKDAPGRPTTVAAIPEVERTSARNTCEMAGVSHPSVLNDCIIDVYCTGDPGLVDSHTDRRTPEARLDVETPIFVDGWLQQGPPNHGNWEVTDEGRAVRQTRNGDPSFYVSAQDYLNTTIRGTLEVQTGGDDDYIGFVFGYQGPIAADGDDPQAIDAFLLAWKQGQQGAADEGFTLARVTQWPQNGAFWDQEEETGYKVLGRDYGSSRGWEDRTEYNFELTYTADRILIKIDGQVIFDVASDAQSGPFPAGRFGFYNYSQSDVRYANFSATDSPTP